MISVSQNKSEEVLPTISDCTELAEFPGGMGAFQKFFAKNLKIENEVIGDGLFGRIYVCFEVDTNGVVLNPVVKRGANAEVDKAIVNVFKKMPCWIPGKECGKVVRQKLVYPVIIDTARE
jgi:protein TonB